MTAEVGVEKVGDTGDPIVFDKVYKRFGSLEVLKGISGRVGSGEVVVICGPSGSTICRATRES